MSDPKRPYPPSPVFRSTVRYFPMVSVNMVVQRPDGAVLFVKRKNNPAKGEWWVPGGRILNGETVQSGMLTILKQETGLEGELTAVCPEYFEEIWNTKDFDAEDWERYEPGTQAIHYVSTVGMVTVKANTSVTLDEQSADILWSRALPCTHPYLRAYFDGLKRMGISVLAD